MTADELLALADPTEGTKDELTFRLRDALAAKAQLDDVVEALRLDLIDRMEMDFEVVPGCGALRRAPKRTTRWRDEAASSDFRRDVFKAITEVIALDPITGEYNTLKANVAKAVLREVDEALPAFTSLKAPGKRRLRIDVDQYRETTETYTLVLEMEDDRA